MKSTVLSIIIAGLIIGGAIFLGRGNSYVEKVDNTFDANNVSMVDGKQVIEIKVRGGYEPRISTAKAGIPTVIKFNTAGTFDCSSAVRIPAIGFSKILPSSGVTEVDLGVREAGIIRGTCGMGMYSFQVDFQ